MSTWNTTLERAVVDLRVGLRPVGGLLYGAVAYVVGFVATITLMLLAVVQRNSISLGDVTASGPIEGSLRALFSVLGWLFFRVHGVVVRRVGETGTNRLDVFEIAGFTDPLAFRLLPVVLLGLAGFVVTHRTRGRLPLGASVLAGASVVLGYGLLTVAGIVGFVVRNGGAVYRPALLPALAIAGLAYPLVCGGIGGLVRGLLGRVVVGSATHR